MRIRIATAAKIAVDQLRPEKPVHINELPKITNVNSNNISAVDQLRPEKPVHINELPKITNVNSNNISAVTPPYSIKQSQSSTSSAAIVSPAANAARKPLP